MARLLTHSFWSFCLMAAIALVGLLAALSLWSSTSDEDLTAAAPSLPSGMLAPVTPEEVARDVAAIQQQLGGSLVSPMFSPFEDSGAAAGVLLTTGEAPLTPSADATRGSHVAVLRESAWELEQMAHRLEVRELYGQADACRALAAQLRSDSRSPSDQPRD